MIMLSGGRFVFPEEEAGVLLRFASSLGGEAVAAFCTARALVRCEQLGCGDCRGACRCEKQAATGRFGNLNEEDLTVTGGPKRTRRNKGRGGFT